MSDLCHRLCTRHDLPPDKVHRWVHRRVFFPGRWLPFQALRAVGLARSSAHEADVIADFLRAGEWAQVEQSIALLQRERPEELGFVRGTLRCRVSARRMWSLAEELLG